MHTVVRHEHDPSALAVQRHLLVADLPEDVHALAWRSRERGVELVCFHARLVRFAQHVLCAEEAIGRHEPLDPLVRPEVVVVREVVPETGPCFAEILRLRALPQLHSDRLPEPLALPERFRVVRARHHVLDPFAHEQALEVRFAAPSEVLATLVGEHFLGFAEALDAFHQRLAHKL